MSSELNFRHSSPRWRSTAVFGTLMVPAAVFLLVAGIGAMTMETGDHHPGVTSSGNAIAPSMAHAGSDGGTTALLADYVRSIGAGERPASAAATVQPLPDVETMIEGLAARLESAPDDLKGWRMLGWSYFHTGRYELAAKAYAKAVAIDPDSVELARSYDEAKAKLLEAANAATVSPRQTGDIAPGSDTARKAGSPELASLPGHERDAAIRSMVDSLAARLESAPRDVDGWTRLLRSRVVLGEREAALTALRKAFEVFMDDQAASGTIAATAAELGLEAR
jgi:cytochrome c-type biogenesis protein CcmH